MAPKQFHVQRDKRPPLDFEITYTRMDSDGEWVDETQKFRARPSIAGASLLKMASTMDSSIGIQSTELLKLLNAAIWPDDKKAFNDLIDDETVAVPIDTLAEILMWLTEEYAEVPTQGP